jgi:hypothetical protein
MKCSKQLSMTMSREKHRRLSVFLDSNMGKFQLKTVSVQRPFTGHIDENMKEVRKIVNKDQQSPISEIAATLHLSQGTCQQILMENLNMEQISMKFVPRLFTNKQKQRCVFVCYEL